MNEKVRKIKELQLNAGLKIRGGMKSIKENFKKMKIPDSVMKQTRKITKPVIEISKKTWGWFDGKKTVIGLITTGVGVGMMYVPVLSFFSNEVIATGVGTIATGVGFKIKKGNKDKVVNFLTGLIKKKK